jgi:glycosyltransferase involved in cell wall biosynthesis
MRKLRVLYILSVFPQISQTYIRSEIEALQDNFELKIISLREPNLPYKNHHPFELMKDSENIEEFILEFKPDVLHTHWLTMSRAIAYFGGFFSTHRYKANIPFTIRAHSFDILDHNGKYVKESKPFINSDLCLGVLTFPFTRPLLEKEGINGSKIFDCYPVVNYQRFYDRKPNGDGIINVGACIPKKEMSDFLKLAKEVANLNFNLYALGFQAEKIEQLNKEMGYPIRIIPPVEPESMLQEYKKHRWLVYTASREYGSVGWPMAVAEAQAAGLGVCIPNIRPDLKEYVGNAGFLYNSISEVTDLISKPYPAEMREEGFIQARKSDVFRHITIITDLWYSTVNSDVGMRKFSQRNNKNVTDWGQGDSVLEKRIRHKENLPSATRALNELIPFKDKFILVGDPAEFAMDNTRNKHKVIPFLEKDGRYWGPPVDDGNAIKELERLRRHEAKFIVFLWSSFWWLDYYSDFNRYIRSNFPCIIDNDVLKIYEISL